MCSSPSPLWGSATGSGWSPGCWVDSDGDRGSIWHGRVLGARPGPMSTYVLQSSLPTPQHQGLLGCRALIPEARMGAPLQSLAFPGLVLLPLQLLHWQRGLPWAGAWCHGPSLGSRASVGAAYLPRMWGGAGAHSHISVSNQAVILPAEDSREKAVKKASEPGACVVPPPNPLPHRESGQELVGRGGERGGFQLPLLAGGLEQGLWGSYRSLPYGIVGPVTSSIWSQGAPGPCSARSLSPSVPASQWVRPGERPLPTPPRTPVLQPIYAGCSKGRAKIVGLRAEAVGGSAVHLHSCLPPSPVLQILPGSWTAATHQGPYPDRHRPRLCPTYQPPRCCTPSLASMCCLSSSSPRTRCQHCLGAGARGELWGPGCGGKGGPQKRVEALWAVLAPVPPWCWACGCPVLGV